MVGNTSTSLINEAKMQQKEKKSQLEDFFFCLRTLTINSDSV